MNAVERLEAAITKLETLKAESTQDRWLLSWQDAAGILEPGESAVVFGSYARPDARLIVTLHRTIDAQLAILRTSLHYVQASLRHGFVEEQGLALADAILGGES